MGVNHHSQLIRRDGQNCHYCKDKVLMNLGPMQKGKRNGKRATKDHVVPKSMGGLGTLDNFVLACADCNEKRGDNLYYCACDFCVGVIEDFMDRNFGGTFGCVKPRVWKHHDGMWVASYGLNSYAWKTWESAMRQIPTHIKANV